MGRIKAAIKARWDDDDVHVEPEASEESKNEIMKLVRFL